MPRMFCPGATSFLPSGVTRISVAEEAARALVARRLRLLREARGFSQSAVARGIQRTQSVVSEWESGRRRMSVPDTWALERFFGVAPGTLLGPPTSEAERKFYESGLRLVQVGRADSGGRGGSTGE